MDLELVEDAGSKRELRGCGAVASTFLSPAARLASDIAVLTSFT
jgi:hypothetical protein